jgi:hypothetical protein
MASSYQASAISVIFLLLGTSSCKRSLPMVATADSPSKTYQMWLKGNPKAPAFFLSRENEMQLDVYKNGKAYLSNVELDSYDSIDADWEILHPDYIWVNDSLLRFGWKKDFSDSDPSYISVKNDTDKALKYIMVGAMDILVLLDLAPKTCTILKAAHQGELGWVTAEGQFEDGTLLAGNHSNFYGQDKVAKPLQYCVTISERAIQIASPALANEQGLIQPSCSCDGQTSERSFPTNNRL